jgi:methanethiol S-methyltransferase
MVIRKQGECTLPSRSELALASLKMTCAVALYCLVHSALASRRVKRAARRIFGTSICNEFYRAFFNAQSLAGFAALALYGRRLPNRDLYTCTGTGAAAMRVLQASGIGWAIWTAREAGIAELLGVEPLLEQRAGQHCALPDAQGPRMGETLDFSGPFLACRHPLNFAPLPVFWATPRLTMNRLVFNILGTAYLVLGSLHEEARLKATYGPAYEEYVRSGVPFFLPDLRRIR